jgi:uncharacterized protein DUF1353
MSEIAFPKDALVVCPQSRSNWILVEQFEFRGTLLGREVAITVPPRFITDFASIPWPLSLFAPKWGEYGWAAVIHDYLYWEQAYSRPDADAIFLEAMRRSKVSLLRREIIYAAVRLFGAHVWQTNSRLKKRNSEARMAKVFPGNPFEAREAVQTFLAERKKAE